MKKNLALIISSIFIIVGFFINKELINKTSTLKKNKINLSENLSYKKRFLNKEEWIKIKDSDTKELKLDLKGIKITLPFVSSGKLQGQIKHLKESINIAHNKVQIQINKILLYIFAYILIMLILFFIYKPHFLFLITTISISIVCLHIGLFTPMLEIGAIEQNFNLAEIPIKKKVLGFEIDVTIQKIFDGDIYFYYQNKSISELIYLLLSQSNYFVGICILLFSVIFPVLKTSMMCFFVLKPSIIQKKWFASFVLNLSKWSMADVFVVAMFLGFLAFENMQAGITTYSNICIGLYFFLSYCLLSISGSILAKMPSEKILKKIDI